LFLPKALQRISLYCLVFALLDMFLMVGNICSSYLIGFTIEIVCFMVVPIFGPLAGNLLTKVRTFHSLQTSGPQWHDKFVDAMQLLDFFHLARQIQICGYMAGFITINMSLYVLLNLFSLSRNHNSF
jgi:hypothetical protein